MPESPVAVRSESEVRALIREIVSELAPNPGPVTGSERKLVDELAYTSLALLELAFTLEDEFELPPIDEHTARAIITVGDVEDYVVAGLRDEGRLGVP
ncbi:MAG: acyl carrier protein [Solirubrobacteraceae bacterium]